MSNSGVNVFSKHARVHDLGPIHSKAGDLQELAFIKDFTSNVTFHVLNLCQIMESSFSRNMRGFMTWDQFHRIQGTCRGGLSQRMLFLSLISSWKFMSNSVVNVFSKPARFQDLGQFHRMQGTCEGGQS